MSVAVLLSACAERTVIEDFAGEPSERSATLELRSSPEEPIGLLTFRGEEQEGELGTHCWATQCVDFIGPPTPKRFTEIPGNFEIDLRGEGEAESISVGRPQEEKFGPLVDERQILVRNGKARLELEPGRYMLVVFARWMEGDAVLTFGLDVV